MLRGEVPCRVFSLRYTYIFLTAVKLNEDRLSAAAVSFQSGLLWKHSIYLRENKLRRILIKLIDN